MWFRANVLAQRPDFINDCNCSLCEKSGGAWGYFDTASVEVSGQTQPYIRQDMESPAIALHFCAKCGVTTHWVLIKKPKRTPSASKTCGVNMNIFDCADLAGVEIRFPEGRSWDGVGQYAYRKSPTIIGE
ncbi:MAG: aldehyde-activating protein [Robiginitomaculum sp.]|nr:MAG: aldehyde-activating protein [Robiginitomaculum sp.]